MGRLVLKESNVSDELSKIVSSINELSERVALLEIDRDFGNITDTVDMEFDWADISTESIDKLMTDIFANDPVAERPLEYNKIQDNVIEFPVKFSRR